MKHTAVGELKARVAAWRHGNPANGLKIIAVAGPHGKTTTALLLAEMLRESGAKVATLTHGTYDQSVEALQVQLANVKKDGAYYVIIEVTDALLSNYGLHLLPLEMSIVTGDSETAEALLEHPANSTVIPSGLDISNLKTAPHQVISFGHDEIAEAQIARVKELRKGTEVEMVIDHQTRIELATYLIGQANALNLAASVSAAYVLAVNTQDFEEGVARLERVAGNYEYIDNKTLPYDVVVDAAHTESSLEIVLASAKKLKKRRLIVVADGSVSPEVHPLIAQTADRMIAVSDAPEVPGVEKAGTLQAAVDVAMRGAKTDDLLLLVGKEFSAPQENGTTKAHQMIGEAKNDE